MGADNTKFQTVNISNPNIPPEGIQVTKDVIKRLEAAAKNAEADKRCGCCVGGDSAKPRQTTPNSPNSSCQDREKEKDAESGELSKDDLASITDKVDKILGKPLCWSKEVDNEIKKLRSKVLQCYNLNGARPLLCANETATFNQFVLTEQTKLLYNTRLAEEQKLEQQKIMATKEKDVIKPTEKSAKKSGGSGGGGGGGGVKGWLSDNTKDNSGKGESNKILEELKKKEEDLKKREDLLRKREEELLHKSEKLKRNFDSKDCEATIIQNISEEFQKLSDGPRRAP